MDWGFCFADTAHVRSNGPISVEGGWVYHFSNKGKGANLSGCADHPPHQSPEEAVACFVKWRESNVLLMRGVLKQGSCGSPDCGDPAPNLVRVLGMATTITPVCAEHSGKESVLAMLFG
mgnify:CR=1 FL=1